MEAKTENLTYTEVQELLRSLSESDRARLLQIYRTDGCEQRAGLSAHDVLAEVVCKVLAMERVWPRGIDTLPYLVTSGRSMISNAEKKYSREITTDPLEIDKGNVESHTTNHQLETVVHTPENTAEMCQSNEIIDKWIVKIRELFADDKDATCFITQKLAALKKATILNICKFTDKVYRNVEKRIKDKVRKKFPKGFPWWEI